MTAGSRGAIFRVSNRLLAKLFNLPEDAHVVRVWQEEGYFSSEHHVLVFSPDLPETPEGARYPACYPTFREKDGRAVFVGWGLDKCKGVGDD